jgi:hypothetical protein
MLNNHQWEEVKSCSEKRIEDSESICCNSCPIQYVCLAEDLAKYRKMLEKLQFVENSGKIGGAIYKFCPVCGNANIHGHKKDCELAELLRTGEENAEFIKARRK